MITENRTVAPHLGGGGLSFCNKWFTLGLKTGDPLREEQKAYVTCWAPLALCLDFKTIRKERSRSNHPLTNDVLGREYGGIL